MDSRAEGEVVIVIVPFGSPVRYNRRALHHCCQGVIVPFGSPVRYNPQVGIVMSEYTDEQFYADLKV